MSLPPSAGGAPVPRSPSAGKPDAHGQAALLLAESLLHTLVERAVLTNAEAVEVIELAAGVGREVAEAAGGPEAGMRALPNLLSRIACSFRADSAPT